MPVLVALALALPWRVARADETAAPPNPSPLLEQLNRETEKLYHDVARGLLRVQVTPPRSNSDPVSDDSPLTKYKELDPLVRRELTRRKGPQASLAEANALPRAETGSTTRSASDADVKLDPAAAIIVVAPPAPGTKPTTFAPNNIGLVLDSAGHVLVPVFIESETAAEQPMHLSLAGGAVTAARFVGSDRQTSLTVLQLPKPQGTPLRLADAAPRDGSLVLMVAPGDLSGRLGMWTGGGRDVAVVFTIEGECAGIARFGQFLSGRACRLIAEQIIRHGSVRRATLGVIITEIRKDDPMRQRSPLLGDRTAVRIDQVMPGSAAEKVGLEAGDVLLALAGESVNDIPTFAAAIAARSGPTELQVLRGTDVLKVTVDLQQK